MDKNDIIEYVMTTPHNTNRAVLNSMLNQLAEGGGGGDGYLGLHTATVNVTFDTSEIDGKDVIGFEPSYIDLNSNSSLDNYAIQFEYGPNAIPYTELGSITQMLVPIADGYYVNLAGGNINYYCDGGSLMASSITVISGEATSVDEFTVAITGDCSLNIKVGYQD